MATPIVAGNWKMNLTVREARDLASAMKEGLDAIEDVQTAVCPPFVALEAVGGLLRGTSIGLGAQNMHFEGSGAYTGEISPMMLAELCQFVIIGHSERRHIFGETDASVAKKMEAARDVGLRPILCVGETLQEREAGDAEAVVERQLAQGMANVGSLESAVVAYEPVWAIGSGVAATPEDAQSMMAHIRRILASRYGEGAASDVALLYGGSVTAENVAEFAREEDIDGALVGGASLSADGFVRLVQNAAEVLA